MLLNGLGLVLIYRLDLETPGDRAAPAQLVWSTLGVALFIVVVLLLRDHRVLQRYAYVCVPPRWSCSSCRSSSRR